MARIIFLHVVGVFNHKYYCIDYELRITTDEDAHMHFLSWRLNNGIFGIAGKISFKSKWDGERLKRDRCKFILMNA